MSAAKLLLKIRRHAQSPYNTALLIILISFGLLNNGSCEIAPKPDNEPTAGDANTLNSDLNAYNSINKNVETASEDSILASKTNVGFLHAFVASLSVILVSELGDKTFFIAAIMAMRHPRLTVFGGAITALALMTILSAVFGMAATVIPRVYTYYISTALFAIFGLKMLKDGYYMSPTDAQEELEEVQSNLRKREDELLKSVRKERHKDDDDTQRDPEEESLDINSPGRRMSGWKTTQNTNSDEDDDGENDRGVMITKSMTCSEVNGNGKVLLNDSTRRTQSAVNLLSMAANGTKSNSPHSLDEGIDVSPMSPSLTNAALSNANTMELRRVRDKKKVF